MRGTVVQINISPGGILKRPIPLAKVSALGIEGDAHAHPQFHGGPLKALLLIAAESIESLKALGYELFPGALGENLTTSGLDRTKMRPGQRFQVGEVLIELTRIRKPCQAMDVYGPGIKEAVFDAAVKAGDANSPRWGLSGFYASVLEPGIIRPGDPIEPRP